MADLRYFYCNRPNTFSVYFDHLCGVGHKSKNPPKVYPLKKITKMTPYGKRVFYSCNAEVMAYLHGEVDTMVKLLDAKEIPVVAEKAITVKESLTPEFLNFYRKAQKIYPFKHKLPEDGAEPSGVLLACQKYYQQILDGSFATVNIFKNQMDKNLSNMTDRDILQSLARWVDYMQEKKRTILGLSTFFYMPKHQISYFLINLPRKEKTHAKATDRPLS